MVYGSFYGNCPMMGGYGLGIFYLNWIIIAIIFALIFWGTYHLLIKNKIDRKK